MKIESIAENSLLYDFYGQLLSKRQQEVMALYHEENFSLSEIAEEFGISRQAVHDTLKKAEQALAEYEQKLGLIRTLQRSEEVIRRIDEKIDALIEEIMPEQDCGEKNCSEQSCSEQDCKTQNCCVPAGSDIAAKLEEIKQIIGTLEA